MPSRVTRAIQAKSASRLNSSMQLRPTCFQRIKCCRPLSLKSNDCNSVCARSASHLGRQDKKTTYHRPSHLNRFRPKSSLLQPRFKAHSQTLSHMASIYRRDNIGAVKLVCRPCPRLNDSTSLDRVVRSHPAFEQLRAEQAAGICAQAGVVG